MSVVDTLLASPPTDLLRLAAVPVFAWAAYRDVATRRVPNATWLPLVTLAVLLLVADAAQVWDDAHRRQFFLVHLGVSLGLVAPLGYVFWRIGGFGGADAKAVMTLALLFPEFPTYFLPSGTLPLPAYQPPLGVFSLTILTNTVVLGIVAPLALAARNAAAGRLAPQMFLGRPVASEAVATEYGRALETLDGFTRRGLDLDALRMYLRWRGLTLAELRADPDRYRDPLSLPPPGERGDPGDGSFGDDEPVGGAPADGLAGDGTFETGGQGDDRRPHSTPVADGARGATPAVRTVDPADPWGAAAFLADLEGDAYGTSPDELRDGLEVLIQRGSVWITPGLPFIVPMFFGLVAALTVGDLMFVVLQALGLAP